jgi:hypothetical protein
MEICEIPDKIGIEKAVMDVIWWDFIGFKADQITVDESPVPINRSHRRAEIARYTRAIFRAVNVRSASDRGFDAYLHFTYGVTFAKGEYWYENPDPYEFFRFLIEKVTQRGKLLDKRGFAMLFYKDGLNRASKWVYNDKMGAQMGITSLMIKEAIDKVHDIQLR